MFHSRQKEKKIGEEMKVGLLEESPQEFGVKFGCLGRTVPLSILPAREEGLS